MLSQVLLGCCRFCQYIQEEEALGVFSLRTFWRVLSRVDSSDSGGGVENLHVFRKETGVLDSKWFRIGVSHATQRLSTRKCESTRLGVPPPTPLRLLVTNEPAPYRFEMEGKSSPRKTRCVCKKTRATAVCCTPICINLCLFSSTPPIYVYKYSKGIYSAHPLFPSHQTSRRRKKQAAKTPSGATGKN